MEKVRALERSTERLGQAKTGNTEDRIAAADRFIAEASALNPAHAKFVREVAKPALDSRKALESTASEVQADRFLDFARLHDLRELNAQLELVHRYIDTARQARQDLLEAPDRLDRVLKSADLNDFEKANVRKGFMEAYKPGVAERSATLAQHLELGQTFLQILELLRDQRGHWTFTEERGLVFDRLEAQARWQKLLEREDEIINSP